MSSIADWPAAGRFRQKSAALTRNDGTRCSRSGTPAARHEEEMGGAIYELGACGIRPLKPLEFIGKLIIA